MNRELLRDLKELEKANLNATRVLICQILISARDLLQKTDAVENLKVASISEIIKMTEPPK